MNPFVLGFQNMKSFEKIIAFLTCFCIILKHVFNIKETIDIFVFAIVLSIIYFPLGFIFLGKPAVKTNLILSLLFGLTYSMGVVMMILGTFNIENYQYLLLVIFLLLLMILLFLIIKLKKQQYSKEYVFSQFLRIGYIVFMNLVILIFKR